MQSKRYPNILGLDNLLDFVRDSLILVKVVPDDDSRDTSNHLGVQDHEDALGGDAVSNQL